MIQSNCSQCGILIDECMLTKSGNDHLCHDCLLEKEINTMPSSGYQQ